MTASFFQTHDRIDQVKNPGTELFSPAKAIGDELKYTLIQDPDFYFFSPDETTSNKLDAVFDVETRAWGDLKISPDDLPESQQGRIIELLSENTLFAVMAGHVLSGHQAAMTSYEGFFPIIASQLNQHLKFLDQLEATTRPPVPSINLLSTSTCWRQDHNGFTHQTPLLISTLLSRPGKVTCFFPADDISARTAYAYALNSTNSVNLITFNKSDEPRWIDSHHADFQLKNGGASVFGFASDDFQFDDKNGHFTHDADLIFTAAGDIATRESIAALTELKKQHPELHLRFIGISALSYNAIGPHDNPLSQDAFEQLFDTKAPILANFHGYPQALDTILKNYAPTRKITTHGFQEKGTTTTPEMMLRLNHAHHDDLLTTATTLLDL